MPFGSTKLIKALGIKLTPFVWYILIKHSLPQVVQQRFNSRILSSLIFSRLMKSASRSLAPRPSGSPSKKIVASNPGRRTSWPPCRPSVAPVRLWSLTATITSTETSSPMFSWHQSQVGICVTYLFRASLHNLHNIGNLIGGMTLLFFSWIVKTYAVTNL